MYQPWVSVSQFTSFAFSVKTVIVIGTRPFHLAASGQFETLLCRRVAFHFRHNKSLFLK